jgi:type II secretion system protein N
MPEWDEILTLDYWREHRMALLYALAALVLFVVFTIGTFPYDQVLTGALMPLGLELSYDSERPAFPVGAVLENVRLINLEQPSAPPLVQSESLKLTPGLATLIGRPALRVSADMYGGRVRVRVRRQDDSLALNLDLTDIDLSRYPVSRAIGTTLDGIVSGKVDFESLGPGMNSQSGNIALESRNVDFAPVKGLPPLRFAILKTSCRIDHATLRVNAFEGTGPDMTVSGSGIIHLGPTLAQSMMDMTLRIQPTVAGRARLGFVFAFLPHPPDNRPYIFHGPLLMPQAS